MVFRFAAVVFVSLGLSAGARAASDTDFIDAPVVPGAVEIEPGRYRSPRSFDETVEYYKQVFKRVGGVRWKNIVTLPTVKAKHLESTRNKTTWEGINIYELQGDSRFYVVPRDKPKATKKADKPKK